MIICLLSYTIANYYSKKTSKLNYLPNKSLVLIVAMIIQ